MDFTFTLANVAGGIYEVFYTEDPFLIVSSPFGPRTEGRSLGTIDLGSGTSTSDEATVTIYNALTAADDQPYWFGIYYITDDSDETAIYSIENINLDCVYQRTYRTCQIKISKS